MIEKKLEALFSQLSEEELCIIEKSDINAECDIDPKAYSRILANVKTKTQHEEITVVSSKKSNKNSMGKRIKALLIAAAIFVILTVGAGAAYQFMLPEGLNKELGLNDMHIKTVVDTEKADENSVRTVQKAVKTNGYTVNFEAIVDGYVILPEFVKALRGLDTAEEIREDRIYAVMTITRDDGKSVFAPDGDIHSCSCCNTLYNFDFTVAVKGYVPNPVMFIGTPWYYEDGNVLYYLCDITDAAIFADRDLSIILFEGFGIDDKIARMNEKGEYYFVDTYDGMGAIFDFDLDDSLADPEAVAKDMAERPYVYVTDPDYTLADEMIAKDEALKKIDLSYAIGNHRWYGWNPLQFGDIPYAETFIELFRNKSRLEKTGIDALNEFINNESLKLDAAITAELERLSGKSVELMTTDDELRIADEIDAFINENDKIKADSLRENFDFVKLEDSSEYCYIDEFIFFYIPADSEYAKIVIVYGDKIVISLECTVNTLINHHIPQNDNALPGSMYSYWYLFGVDEDSRYAKLYNEEDYKLHAHDKCEQDAIFSLVSEFTNYDGTVEVLR